MRASDQQLMEFVRRSGVVSAVDVAEAFGWDATGASVRLWYLESVGRLAAVDDVPTRFVVNSSEAWSAPQEVVR